MGQLRLLVLPELFRGLVLPELPLPVELRRQGPRRHRSRVPTQARFEPGFGPTPSRSWRWLLQLRL